MGKQSAGSSGKKVFRRSGSVVEGGETYNNKQTIINGESQKNET